ncbi:MAG: hypothetical protein ACJAWV_000765 [Flammeovirgaceae bacterium]|jgi:hypothetical protein
MAESRQMEQAFENFDLPEKPFVETEIYSTIFPQFSITTEEMFKERL